jgi:4,5-dihydroxyphthalate decarboxylase
MITLHAAIASYPHISALKDGRVASPRLAFAWEEVEPITRAFRRQVRGGAFDLCEIALTTHAQAHAYGKGITALPVVVMRGFHHGALVCPADSPLRGPADLVGKRVGVRAFSQTTGVWVRGILREEYGIDHRAITWVTAEDAHVLEYADPPNVVRIAPGQDLRTLLLTGEIDAAIALPGLEAGTVRTVIPDAEVAAAAWYRKTGAYPVNHVLCVRDRLLAEHAWLADELYGLCQAAKSAATAPSAESRYRAIVGDDSLPYGLEANRIGITLCLRYAAEQGLIPTQYAPEALFARF